MTVLFTLLWQKLSLVKLGTNSTQLHPLVYLVMLNSQDSSSLLLLYEDQKIPYLVTQLHLNQKKKQRAVLKKIWKWGWPSYLGKPATPDIKDSFYLRNFVSSD